MFDVLAGGCWLVSVFEMLVCARVGVGCMLGTPGTPVVAASPSQPPDGFSCSLLPALPVLTQLVTASCLQRPPAPLAPCFSSLIMPKVDINYVHLCIIMKTLYFIYCNIK